jgi:hypothetical protein
MQLFFLREKLLFGLFVCRIRNTAIVDRAYLGALWLVVKPHALVTLVGIDDVNIISLSDRLVGALGLTGSAVNALLVDQQRHQLHLLTLAALYTNTN